MSKPNGSKQDVYAMVTDQVVKALESGTVPWRQPWQASGFPKSMSTGKNYRGANVFLLGLTATTEGYSSPWWGTYKQIEERGGQVRKGEKSTLVVFWKKGTYSKPDADGEASEKSYVMLRYFRVFNAEQADGLPAKFYTAPDAQPIAPIDACDLIARGYIGRPPVGHGGDRAFYSPSRDHIQMPARDAFKVSEEYYSTLFHEMTHSTGHASRLNREGIVEGHSFGDELYSKEELIAEMGAAMLCGLAGIENVTLGNSAAYLASWVRVLKGDAKLVVSAAAAAQKAADHITGATFDDESAKTDDRTPVSA